LLDQKVQAYHGTEPPFPFRSAPLHEILTFPLSPHREIHAAVWPVVAGCGVGCCGRAAGLAGGGGLRGWQAGRQEEKKIP